MKTIYAFCGGAAIVGLLAAAMFRNTTPVDQTFTYQGQLRNAGQLVNGPVDLKISMWDADTAGVQIGTSNTFNAVPMTDGRFALGLNFGASAFDGSNRWIQVEFRNPAGSGLYQALNPRDKITATPYALYALNGANGVWVYDTKQQSVSVLGKKVGIGTSNPTAALEVVSAMGGDDSVKLPVGSIGESELAVSLPASATLDFGFTGNPGQYGPESVAINFVAPGNGWVTILGNRSNYWGCSSLKWNGQELATGAGFNMFRFPVTAGESYSLVAKQVCYISTGAGGTFLVLYTQRALN